MSKTLYVGVDDSNNGRQPLIVAAYFSYNLHDKKMVLRRIPSGKDHRCLRIGYDRIYSMLQGKNNYRFVVDEEGKLAENGRQLILAAPFLINAFLNETKKRISNVEIFLDGFAKKEDREFVAEEIDLECKVRGVRKSKTRFAYPEVLRIADSIAHFLYAYRGFRSRRNIKRRQVELI